MSVKLGAGAGAGAGPMPKIRWTPAQDKILIDGVKANGGSTGKTQEVWDKVSALLDGAKDPVQCYRRYDKLKKTDFKPNETAGKVWTPEEEALLLEAFEACGGAEKLGNHKGFWKEMSAYFADKGYKRNNNQIGEKFKAFLNQAEAQFTNKEIVFIVKKYEEMGNNWNLITQQLNGKFKGQHSVVKVRAAFGNHKIKKGVTINAPKIAEMGAGSKLTDELFKAIIVANGSRVWQEIRAAIFLKTKENHDAQALRARFDELVPLHRGNFTDEDDEWLLAKIKKWTDPDSGYTNFEAVGLSFIEKDGERRKGQTCSDRYRNLNADKKPLTQDEQRYLAKLILNTHKDATWPQIAKQLNKHNARKNAEIGQRTEFIVRNWWPYNKKHWEDEELSDISESENEVEEVAKPAPAVKSNGVKAMETRDDDGDDEMPQVKDVEIIEKPAAAAAAAAPQQRIGKIPKKSKEQMKAEKAAARANGAGAGAGAGYGSGSGSGAASFRNHHDDSRDFHGDRPGRDAPRRERSRERDYDRDRRDRDFMLPGPDPMSMRPAMPKGTWTTNARGQFVWMEG